MRRLKPTYEPHDIESRWYDRWQSSGAFRPEINPDGEPFSIVIPPPNVTGVLHTGHALNMSMQDAIIRRKRMQGYAALWVPGTDHAGIATQNVVERELAAEGLTRHDLGREAFIEQVWQWKASSGDRIAEQVRRLGFSPDWSRERFTLDDVLSAAVREVFVTLYDEGLIYRGTRIINWCPKDHTALSDIEVDHHERPGELVFITYPFTDGPLDDGTEGVVVATTRVETMLGDTGVAVHPDDERYTSVVGKTVRLPIMERDIPIVEDEGVDPDFGTGAVKVTPAHDPLDYEIGQRHGLEPVIVIGEDGSITEAGGPFAGYDRFDARIAVKRRLEEEGRIVAVEQHMHSVGVCSRCKSVVEPLISTQWFVKVGPLVGPAIDVVKNDISRFIPKRWEKQYFHWMENLRDWCISRQLWWGHRIPAWYCDACGETVVAREEPAACPSCDGRLRAEEDVLDTWFSSALWPFSTLGWPEQTEDLAKFYPTNTMVTGFDIIYFWVARMLKMGLHFMHDRPFDDIVIHGLVRDAEGKKMSKSTGNAMDPLELANRYGADALRLTLLQSAVPGHDIPLNEEWIDASRRFGNKLWNALRFAVEHSEVRGVPQSAGYPSNPHPEAAWILSRLHEVASEVDELYEEYRFADAATALYNFAWSEVFDWYIEMAKLGLRSDDQAAETRQTLGVVLRDLLKLFHPIIPFLTEELWSELGDGSLLITASWPDPPKFEAPAAIGELQELVTAIRRFRAEHNLGRRTIEAQLETAGDEVPAWWLAQLESLGGIAVTATVTTPPPGLTRISGGSVALHVALGDLIDVVAERQRIEKAIAEAEELVAGSLRKLANSNFVERAPAAVVAQERDRVEQQESRIAELRTQLERLPA